MDTVEKEAMFVPSIHLNTHNKNLLYLTKENAEFAVPYAAIPVATGETTAVAEVAAHMTSQQERQHSWQSFYGHLVDPCIHGT